ncbi:right-handed parallel beta-helix repeat-containing protein [Laribacter hongkongensis]|uniref:right-handed parallel beta-helix repeat-containing protein n=1 Tax=Laribacter hongkongensis TaxID=168471 RepID=UPI001EFC61D3|nr:right-handed parallel beta-helix repeat-containing protein [Laribacter hongkongensis]MCG9077541.1 right-handed parallel beta-helix repeat-containing protein [Laribacter hongkongensis]
MNLLPYMILGALTWNIGVASAYDVNIHVSPNGNDAREGGSEVDAVSSIGRAMKLAEAAPAGTTQAKIILTPGTYKGQTVRTRGNGNDVPILITNGSGGRAVFDGDGKGGTWLTLEPRGGNPSNIKIKSIEVRNYETAIDVRGNRNNPSAWAGGLEIRDCWFANIGDIARADAVPSTAAIRLVNSDRNVIAGNWFSHIQNRQRCVLLHSLYIAHGSTDNLVEGNTFDDSCGDAIRFRDEANNNVVRDNTFIDAWSRSPVSDWFCNQGQRNDCTKASGECPSENNLLENNKVVSRKRDRPTLFMSYGGDPPSGCGTGVRGVIR